MVGALGIVLSRERERRQRICFLEQMEKIVSVFEHEVGCRLATLEECARSAATQTIEPFRTPLQELGTGRHRKKGQSFAKAFCFVMQEGLQSYPWMKEDLQLFCGFISRDSTLSRESLLLGMQRTEELLRKRRKEWERKQENQRQLELGLGVLGGLFLIVILL